ncbi:hypothetical protein OTSGILL_2792 [Orientia tsutsugamushi str. Gilliam]|uniref:Uncharacterized protein n=1 Tax=Orientia tsutsugamushi str. Gilliam TaxID=1359184 RepID=A0A0F3M841_ORITS|nr:hypothetical protein OTSGILL_2792 [Orientia tsutsugamushi str. Gilliam]
MNSYQTLERKAIDFLFKTEKTNKSLILVGETDVQNFNITQVAHFYENQGNGQVNSHNLSSIHSVEYVNYDHPVSYNTLYLVDDLFVIIRSSLHLRWLHIRINLLA